MLDESCPPYLRMRLMQGARLAGPSRAHPSTLEYDPTFEWTLHGAAQKNTANAKTSSDVATAPDALNMLVGRLEVRLERDCVRAGV